MTRVLRPHLNPGAHVVDLARKLFVVYFGVFNGAFEVHLFLIKAARRLTQPRLIFDF